MNEQGSRLLTPQPFNILRHRATSKTVRLPNGRLAKITVDDSGTVQHTECDDRLDALVRPKSITIKLLKG